MKTKINHNGHCLYCGKDSQAPFCNRQCYTDYVRIGVLPDPQQSARAREKKRRDSLPDSIVKKAIYIASKGRIKYSEITPEMIIKKREDIIVFRQRRNELGKDQPGLQAKREKHYCEICSKDITVERPNKKTCSNECRKEKARRDNVNHNKAKKALKERVCRECGKPFTPEYGNKRRDFDTDKCLKRFQSRGTRKNIERARWFGVSYEYVSVNKVFDRDEWHCQICGKPTPRERRGTYYPDAPELDHRIPISKGGGHLYSNVQCACRYCNGKKSNHSEAGQLPLFGNRSVA